MIFLMCRATLRICKFLVLGMVTLGFSGCALFEQKAGPKPVTGPQEKVFFASFDDVWRATQLALQSPTAYPLRVNNMDTGVLETEPIKGAQAWSPPHVTDPPTGGVSYRLSVRVIKGNLSGRQAFKVTVLKEASIQRDFFSEPEPIVSDGLEEKIILYRIDRELQIDRALKRANRKQNQKP